ncbi:MAG: deoxyguanosinetriphosphate triphosphohydrolase [Selenomonadales bacterium]|nr:deoxyguanosinetriphosphate triphosphohydrolase [Selenomonadales bacterium]
MDSIRKKSEEIERQFLSPYALYSDAARRDRAEENCPIRTSFQRDRDRILHSKSFRRLKHKTQVYISPGDHYRTRMTHSLEVAQIARTIARALRLNEDATEAMALGHDVGHTPFGHSGEYALDELIGHYSHNEQSLRIVEYLEKNGQGLNLTEAVRDGILCHTGARQPQSLEGKIVRISDRIAYLCHDYDDSLRAGLLYADELPSEICHAIGQAPSDMITAMVVDIIQSSKGQSEIYQSERIRAVMDSFRQFMFERVYHSEPLQPDRDRATYVLTTLFEYFHKYSEKLPEEFRAGIGKWGLEQVVADYIAGLTDVYAIELFEQIFIPRKWMGYQSK